MFRLLLENEYVSEIKSSAVDTITQERLKFADIFTFVIKYIHSRDVFISNVDLLLDEHKYWENMEIYVTDAEIFVKQLMGELCQNFPKIFELRSNSDINEHTISYDMRNMILTHDIKTYGSLSLYEYISPIKYENTYLFPPLLEIIQLYRLLYNPENAPDWEAILTKITKLEKKYVFIMLEEFVSKSRDILEKMFTTSLNTSKQRVVADDDQKCEQKDLSVCEQMKLSSINSIKELILGFLAESDYIVLDSVAYAVDSAQTVELSDIKIFRIVSGNKIEDDYEIFVNFLSKHITHGFLVKEKSVFLPNDMMIKKHIIYMIYHDKKNKTTQKPLIESFNNTSYELINFHVTEPYGFRIADPITQIRFAYIEVWTAVIAQKMYGLEYERFQAHMKQVTKMLKFYIKRIDIYELKKNYFGTYINPLIHKKMILLETAQQTKTNFKCFEF